MLSGHFSLDSPFLINAESSNMLLLKRFTVQLQNIFPFRVDR